MVLSPLAPLRLDVVINFWRIAFDSVTIIKKSDHESSNINLVENAHADS